MSAETDRQHLDLLGIFHYIVAGITALFSLFPVIHLVVGLALVTGRFDDTQAEPGAPDAALFGWFFVVFAAFVIVCGLTLAIVMALTGRYLRRSHHHTFCLVVAAIECIFMPFGTVLGVFTILVLSRASVKRLFADA